MKDPNDMTWFELQREHLDDMADRAVFLGEAKAQCEGCQKGLPLTDGGEHILSAGLFSPMTLSKCQATKYRRVQEKNLNTEYMSPGTAALRDVIRQADADCLAAIEASSKAVADTEKKHDSDTDVTVQAAINLCMF